MKTRDFRGGTLGLVAVVTLVIAILGFAFFFFGKFLGGNRQLQMATDAGAINTAKQAAVGIRVDVNNLGFGLGPAPAFAGLGDPPNVNEISLATYNRAVGKALLVALNAQSEGTVAAGISAREVFRQLQNLGTALQRRLAQGGPVNGYFRDLANANNIRLVAVGAQPQLIGNVTTAFMRPDGRANISFRFEPNSQLSADERQRQVENTLPPGITMPDIRPFESDSSIQSTENQRAYLRGYRPFDIPVPGGGVRLAFLPNFPGDRPHNVALAEFEAARTSPLGYSPPNAFGADAQAQEGRTGLFERVLSRAIVGVLGNASTVSIPRGYIRFRNGPSVLPQLVARFPECVNDDHANSIFNNELAVAGPNAGAGIVRSNNGIFGTINSGGAALINNPRNDNGFVQYNNSEGQVRPPNIPDRLNRDPAKDPFGRGVTPSLNPGQFIDSLRIAGNPGRRAKVEDALRIRSVEYSEPCTYQNLTASPCSGMYLDSGETNLAVYARNYERYVRPGRGIDPDKDANNIELVKAEVIAEANKFYPNTTGGMIRTCFNVESTGGPPSGIKVFLKDRPYHTPVDRINFAEPGTPYDYLFFAGSCSLRNASLPYDFSPDTIAGQIAQRAREILPGVTTDQIRTLLDSRVLRLGTTLYLFRRGNQLVLEPTLPPEWGINDAENAPDGRGGSREQLCASDYPLEGQFVNTAAQPNSNPPTEGDCGVHLAPFMSFERANPNGDIMATDRVRWTPSTGGSMLDVSGNPTGGNLLGDCLFENLARGAGRFCNIN